MEKQDWRLQRFEKAADAMRGFVAFADEALALIATLAAVQDRVDNARKSLMENNHHSDWSEDKVAALLAGLDDALTPAVVGEEFE